MLFVVDTNVLFAFFSRKSFTRVLFINVKVKGRCGFLAPLHALEELKKHKESILSKFSLKEEEFDKILEVLKALIEFIPEDEYKQFLPEAKAISPDPEDVPFFALALKFSCPIWSNDKRLKEQDKVLVLGTKEIAKLFL